MIEIVCELCGEKVITKHPKQKWCPKCKAKGDSEYKKFWYQNNKSKIQDQKKSTRAKKHKKKKTTHEQCVEIESKCKDMCISYGEYVRKYERGNYYG